MVLGQGVVGFVGERWENGIWYLEFALIILKIDFWTTVMIHDVLATIKECA